MARNIKVAFAMPNEEGFTPRVEKPVKQKVASSEKKPVKKKADDIDVLFDGLFEAANGVWLVIQGVFKMGMWFVLVIVDGLKVMWSGLDKKKESKVVKNGKKSSKTKT